MLIRKIMFQTVFREPEMWEFTIPMPRATQLNDKNAIHFLRSACIGLGGLPHSSSGVAVLFPITSGHKQYTSLHGSSFSHQYVSPHFTAVMQ